MPLGASLLGVGVVHWSAPTCSTDVGLGRPGGVCTEAEAEPRSQRGGRATVGRDRPTPYRIGVGTAGLSVLGDRFVGCRAVDSSSAGYHQQRRSGGSFGTWIHDQRVDFGVSRRFQDMSPPCGCAEGATNLRGGQLDRTCQRRHRRRARRSVKGVPVGEGKAMRGHVPVHPGPVTAGNGNTPGSSFGQGRRRSRKAKRTATEFSRYSEGQPNTARGQVGT